MMEDYHNYSEKLTNIARNIFGDIIEAVYSAYYDKHNKLQVEKMLDTYEHTNTSIECDTLTIVMHFKNGNIVSFTNSEWGQISKIDKLNIEKL